MERDGGLGKAQAWVWGWRVGAQAGATAATRMVAAGRSRTWRLCLGGLQKTGVLRGAAVTVAAASSGRETATV